MKKEKKSTRNKTIDLSVEEGKAYLERCISIGSKAGIDEITDKTILGDTFSVMPLLPEGFADLIIVDPPYNLTKDFHGSRFRETTETAATGGRESLSVRRSRSVSSSAAASPGSAKKAEAPRTTGKTAWRISGLSPSPTITPSTPTR